MTFIYIYIYITWSARADHSSYFVTMYMKTEATGWKEKEKEKKEEIKKKEKKNETIKKKDTCYARCSVTK